MPVDWVLWKRWFLANTIGGAIGWLLACAGTGLTFGILTGLLSGFVVSSSVGIAQVGVLTSYGPPLLRPQYSGIWIAGTIIGGYFGFSTIGAILFWAYSDFGIQLEEIVLNPVSIFSTLLLLSTVQWSLLRSNTRRAAWWIPGSLVGWTFGLSVGIPIAQVMLGRSSAAFDLWLHALTMALTGTIVTLIYAATTGFVLTWLVVNNERSNI